ncbi:MAG: DUF2442 domain-containing protein [Bacteroides sp.]|nr:DUF2442 domain-containing protein [Prevotella sp.]MCM1407691.1 DUF2442 domain-containing protein [Treponema brennaborense]MCM1469159.1 DUF2442 domain-containing protein [Bacteroides sp.]
MLHVENAKYIGEYKIDIAFDDGTRRLVDLESVVFSDGRKIVSELKDLALFKDFSIQRHTVTWKNGLDFAPEFLREQ